MRALTIMTTTLCLGFIVSSTMAEDKSDGLLDRLLALEKDSATLKKAIGHAVLASEVPCEILGEGWVTHAASEGMFLLGAGGGHTQGDSGGAAEVTLTIPQMPRHTHPIELSAGANPGGRPESHYSNSDNGRWGTDIPKYAGDNMAHENMPPYRVVHFCKLGG